MKAVPEGAPEPSDGKESRIRKGPAFCVAGGLVSDGIRYRGMLSDDDGIDYPHARAAVDLLLESFALVEKLLAQDA